jgi:hypothetical protein
MKTLALFFFALCSLTMTKKLNYGYDSIAADSCANMSLNDSVLEGFCQNAWGGLGTSKLNINPYVGNIDGTL